MDVLKNLNQQQKKAVRTIKGPVLIVAGAGAGKTRVITHRIAYLISQNIPSQNILAVTFTNKAANEMKERIIKLSGWTNQNEKPFVGTFHSLGAKILRENGKKINIPRNFSILDENDSLKLIKESLQELNLNPKQWQPGRIRGFISQNKNLLKTADVLLEETQGEYFPQTAGKIWEAYEEKLKSLNALDFDDLIVKTIALFKKNQDVAEQYQDKWKYIHIDEYQDTNHSQYAIINLLAKKHGNICVVGDIDQAIYGWRQADYRNILNFERDWPKAEIITLEENYRSRKNILEAANEVIANNKLRLPKNLFTNAAGEGAIKIFTAENETEEALHIVKIIKELPDASRTAVLYRANFQSRAIEEALLAKNMPYQLLGVKFYERKEIKDILAYIKAAINPSDFLSIQRIINTPPRGIGKTTTLKYLKKLTSNQMVEEGGFSEMPEKLPKKKIKQLENFQSILKEIKEKSSIIAPSLLIKFVIEKTGYREFLEKSGDEGISRFENLKELVSFAKKYNSFEPALAIEKLLEDAALMSDQDTMEEKKEGVKLMTVHASKGLEFKNVFIVGLEEGLFPHASFGEENAGERQEEERRLFYVALTRAEENVFLSWANARTVFGDRKINLPSRFLSEIPERLIDSDFEYLIEND